MTSRKPRQYAERGKVKRETISLVLPAYQVKHLRRAAERRGDSVSLVASEMFDEAMGLGEKPSEQAS